jgi:hypothetical protein
LGKQLAIWMYSFAGMDLQLFSLNFWMTGCVSMAYLVEFHAITKILLTLREITKKIFNYQKSQKNCEILPKVIKITKSGHIGFSIN